ncbi:MAG TPA: 3-methyl-2-oxobutanoate dehydrogenase subunit VorB [Synergistales bacterium]|nr:3-methyl-2-oxobutanoate dehydrogenase subunit VorB [Synergistales bacterium]
MEKKFLKGNEAVAEAAILAGCRFFAGYPITPQNEIPEYMARRMPQVGGVFLQGESETASVCMVYGAAAMGKLAMTSSSGPGISLKAEGISTLAGAQLPAVIVNVMRGGPGLGTIQAAQSDYLHATKAMGHGGFRVLVLAPSTVQEAIDLTYKAFGLAVKYQNPAVVLMDGWIGSMMEPVTLPEAKEPVKNAYTGWGTRYYNPSGSDVDVVTSCLLEPDRQELLNIHFGEMYETWARDEVMVEEYLLGDAEYVIVAYGTAARAARTAIGSLREKGVKAGMLRPISLYPFPYDALKRLDKSRVRCILDTEMTLPVQMKDDIRLGVTDAIPVHSCGRSGGVVLTNEDIEDALLRIIEEEGK